MFMPVCQLSLEGIPMHKNRVYRCTGMGIGNELYEISNET